MLKFIVAVAIAAYALMSASLAVAIDADVAPAELCQLFGNIEKSVGVQKAVWVYAVRHEHGILLESRSCPGFGMALMERQYILPSESASLERLSVALDRAQIHQTGQKLGNVVLVTLTGSVERNPGGDRPKFVFMASHADQEQVVPEPDEFVRERQAFLRRMGVTK